ncbi:MAG: cell division protein ZapA [Alphaproteobacteria bacterium]|nr:cell division protein ZapA [Alphaproteobacteria bacterium]
MSQVTITINSREYAVACEDGQESSIIRLSRVLDEKAKLLTQGNQQVNENMLLAMVGLLLADELNELKKSMTNGTAPVASTIIQGYNDEDVSALDTALATQINELTAQIKTLANQIKML